MAPLVRLLEQHPAIDSRVCVTAQHRHMLDDVLEVFRITPHYDLDIMQHNQSMFGVTCRVLAGMEDVLEREKPDCILVQGDTTTTFVASLAAFYRKIPVGHVEAGLRTNDKHHPFPEEINRRLTTTLSDMHFAPTERAKDAILAEGIASKDVYLTGNTVIDALAWTLNNSATSKQELSSLVPVLSSAPEKLVLVTVHRRESFGEPFGNIFGAIRELALQNSSVQIVFPVHPNPNVRQPVERLLSDVPNIHLVEPLQYSHFVHLMQAANFIISDSGGIQEEAPFLGKPVLVVRERTERIEAVEAGTARLVGTNQAVILKEASRLLHDTVAYNQMSRAANPFGDGRAAERIVEILAERFSTKS
ncbi:MAG: UDP-N-acetylglucosamine 2-epimerase (non-hydrolyzing) [Bdellovibrionales bacterium]|nr:UDP-N-acetylglucosamine 2-epimerase (non-hydrolyzing) [Bdellovibrionales bacterium]